MAHDSVKLTCPSSVVLVLASDEGDRAMQEQELMERIQDVLAELATLNSEAASVAETMWSALVEYHGPGFRNAVYGGSSALRLSPGCPLINAATFTVLWRGRCCDLGPSILFKFIQRLARRPNRYYSYEVLMTDVWDRRCSNTTVRSAVKRLRKALCAADMDDLAAAIKGRGECYGLFLDGERF